MDISQAQAWAIVIASIVGAVAAIAGTIVSTVNALRMGRTEAKMDTQAEKIHDIGVSTDGAMSIARDALKISNERVTQLEEHIKNTSGGDVPETTKQTAPRDPAPPPEIVAAETPVPVAPVPPITPTPKQT